MIRFWNGNFCSSYRAPTSPPPRCILCGLSQYIQAHTAVVAAIARAGTVASIARAGTVTFIARAGTVASVAAAVLGFAA